MWEDKANTKGSEFQITFESNITLDTLSEIWEQVVFRIVTGEFKHGEDITGARVVDKCKTGLARYRVEIWYKNDVNGNKVIQDELKADLIDKYGGKLMFNLHSTA